MIAYRCIQEIALCVLSTEKLRNQLLSGPVLSDQQKDIITIKLIWSTENVKS